MDRPQTPKEDKNQQKKQHSPNYMKPLNRSPREVIRQAREVTSEVKSLKNRSTSKSPSKIPIVSPPTRTSSLREELNRSRSRSSSPACNEKKSNRTSSNGSTAKAHKTSPTTRTAMLRAEHTQQKLRSQAMESLDNSSLGNSSARLSRGSRSPSPLSSPPTKTTLLRAAHIRRRSLSGSSDERTTRGRRSASRSPQPSPSQSLTSVTNKTKVPYIPKRFSLDSDGKLSATKSPKQIQVGGSAPASPIIASENSGPNKSRADVSTSPNVSPLHALVSSKLEEMQSKVSNSSKGSCSKGECAALLKSNTTAEATAKAAEESAETKQDDSTKQKAPDMTAECDEKLQQQSTSSIATRDENGQLAEYKKTVPDTTTLEKQQKKKHSDALTAEESDRVKNDASKGKEEAKMEHLDENRVVEQVEKAATIFTEQLIGRSIAYVQLQEMTTELEDDSGFDIDNDDTILFENLSVDKSHESTGNDSVNKTGITIFDSEPIEESTKEKEMKNIDVREMDREEDIGAVAYDTVDHLATSLQEKMAIIALEMTNLENETDNLGDSLIVLADKPLENADVGLKESNGKAVIGQTENPENSEDMCSGKLDDSDLNTKRNDDSSLSNIETNNVGKAEEKTGNARQQDKEQSAANDVLDDSEKIDNSFREATLQNDEQKNADPGVLLQEHAQPENREDTEASEEFFTDEKKVDQDKTGE